MSLQTENDQASDDFADGFNDAPTTTPEPASQSEQVAEVKAPDPVPEYKQITQQEYETLLSRAAEIDTIKATHKQQLDTAFGKIGGIERYLSQLQVGGQVSVTEDDYAELKAEFGEEMARAQVAAMNRVLSRLQPSQREPGIPPERLQAIEQSTGALRSDLINAELDSIVDNWDQEVKTPEFDEWMNKQTDDIKALALSSSVRDAARMLRLYSNAKSAKAAELSAKANKQARQRQIDAAISPKGIGGNPGATEVDPFAAGFNEG